MTAWSFPGRGLSRQERLMSPAPDAPNQKKPMIVPDPDGLGGQGGLTLTDESFESHVDGGGWASDPEENDGERPCSNPDEPEALGQLIDQTNQPHPLSVERTSSPAGLLPLEWARRRRLDGLPGFLFLYKGSPRTGCQHQDHEGDQKLPPEILQP